MRPEDFLTPCWRRLAQLLDERIEALREQNDQSLSMDQTMRIRGQIRMCKEILSLPQSLGFEAAPDSDGTPAA